MLQISKHTKFIQKSYYKYADLTSIASLPKTKVNRVWIDDWLIFFRG